MEILKKILEDEIDRLDKVVEDMAQRYRTCQVDSKQELDELRSDLIAFRAKLEQTKWVHRRVLQRMWDNTTPT